jgi:hypothetical protein
VFSLKLIFAVPGIIILIVGAYLAYSPASLSQVSNQLGFSTSQNTVDRTILVSVRPGNYSSLAVVLSPPDTMTASLRSDPPGTDVLLMDQGNFSKYVANNGSSVSIYPASLVNVSTYTLIFNDPGSAGNYYLVFQNPQSIRTTDVLVHLTLSSATTVSYASYIPIIIALIGLILFAIGLISRKKTGSSEEIKFASRADVKPVANGTTACRYCNASMNRGQIFCPSCKKSQM